MFKRAVLVLSLSLCALPAAADSVSRSSQASLAASGLIVQGSATMLAGSTMLTVVAVQAAGDAARVVLQKAGEASTITLQIASEVVGATSLAAGASVQVVTEAAGYALVHAGKLIAYIPNEVGSSMVHQSRSGR